MSHRINLGDGEFGQSLPSWISDHLGRKFYIIDEANRSPLLSKGSLLDHLSPYPEMDTSSLTKETNVMSQTDLDKLRVVNSGKSYNALPALTEIEAKRMAEVLGKIEPGGYFDVSKVLGSKTFKKHFAVGRMEISSSGGDNIISGDKGEFRGDFQYVSSCDDYVEYLGAIRGDIGMIARKAFPDTPDMTLLRWLRGKVQDPFTNLFPKGSDSTRISPSAPSQKAGEKTATKDAGMEATPQPPSKRVIIQEKRPREGDYAAKKGELDSSKGKEALPLPPPKSFKSNKGAINATMRTSVPGTSLPLGNDLDSEVSMMSGAHMARKATKSGTESAKSKVVARLEAEVAELTSKLVQAKKLAIEEFKSSEDFKVAVTDSAAIYFSDGFEFCKRQLLHQYPNPGIDMASMEIDASFTEEEEVAKEGEKEVDNKGRAAPTS
ncbi:COPII coat assembly protein like [Actinidia chinensis var. chinensis]|uniref:COPII coat assembly protein like n=1 Tax=Actinidia chinensis var. chinensis TaxID=1590841 RepID=A0A2R6Q8P9_ACTCC|nr:COPII coat assembly protein like [Actinidia chinensis var. chinensis]